MVSASMRLWAAYVVTVSLFAVGSFFPATRAWGVASWAYYPLTVRLMFVALAVAVPVLASLAMRGRQSESSAALRTTPWVVALMLVFTMLFVVGRGATHFLGDGYTALASMAGERPIIKARGLVEGLAHWYLVKALGGPSEAHALLSYQIISVVAGLLYVAAVAYVAVRQYTNIRDRMLFALGMLSGGYLLLYFGYVENYSLFVVSVCAFTLAGLLVLQQRASVWMVVPSLAAALLCHVFGVALIPAAIYLFSHTTGVAKHVRRLPSGVKIMLALVGLTMAGIATYALYTGSYFFRIALLTPLRSVFTVDSYTLFAPAHVLDFVGLLLLLVPALPVGLLLLTMHDVRRRFQVAPYRFLAIMAVCSLGIAFIFDPKLGMPRDWDLFSFAGIPLAVLFFSLLLDGKASIPQRYTWAISAAVLGFMVLGARVGIQADESRALNQIADYIALDPLKGKHAILYLIEYHKRHGNGVELAKWQRRWMQYPDVQLLSQADSLLQRDQVIPAVALLEQATQRNPMSAPAYAYLGSANVRMGRCHEALRALRIAEGLNPHNVEVQIGLGYTYFCLGDGIRAEHAFRTATRVAPARAEPYFALAQYYKQLMQPGKYQEYLMQALSKADASARMFAELGDFYLVQSRYDKAAGAFRRGLMKGLDTSVVMSRIRSRPELLPYFRQ